MSNQGQRAFVGKVNMTVNCDEDYGENVAESLAETERFVQTMNKKQVGVGKQHDGQMWWELWGECGRVLSGDRTLRPDYEEETGGCR